MASGDRIRESATIQNGLAWGYGITSKRKTIRRAIPTANSPAESFPDRAGFTEGLMARKKPDRVSGFLRKIRPRIEAASPDDRRIHREAAADCSMNP